MQGIFLIECQYVKSGTAGTWFPIYHTYNGANASLYLSQCVESETGLTHISRNYRLTYIRSTDATPELHNIARYHQATEKLAGK